MNSKPFYTSKTLWANLVAAIALIVQSQTGFVVDAEVQAAIIVVVNMFCRAVTGNPLSMTR